MTLAQIVNRVVSETHGEHLKPQIVQRVLDTVRAVHSGSNFDRDTQVFDFEVDIEPGSMCLGALHDTVDLSEIPSRRKVVNVICIESSGAVHPCAEASNYQDFHKDSAYTYFQMGDRLYVKGLRAFQFISVQVLVNPELTETHADSWVMDIYPTYVIKAVLAETMKIIGDDAWQLEYREAKELLADIKRMERRV